MKARFYPSTIITIMEIVQKYNGTISFTTDAFDNSYFILNDLNYKIMERDDVKILLKSGCFLNKDGSNVEILFP